MKGIIFILIASLLWAIDTLVRYPLLFKGHSAELIVFGEHLFLVLFLLPIILKSRKKFLSTKVSNIFYFFVIGGLGSAIGTLTFTKAFFLVNPSLVILLQKLQPVIAIALSALILKERMKPKFFLWAIVALIGGVMISYQDLAPGVKLIVEGQADFTSNSLKGYSLALIAVISWGAATVFGKVLSKQGFDEKEIMSGRFLMGLICLLPFLLTFNIDLNFSAIFWGKVFFLAFISGAVGMYFYYRGLKLIPAHLCTLAEMFFPFFAVIVNWIFLGKELSMLQITGASLLLLSSTVIQLKHY
ncbi:DMT family transporter [Bacteriovorax sp. Seq25_V]|uniref:DMT family transporter n=1 Tax=Bacteriovorax sp. Seq25_V TaxID=1201288 RepID=UPI00038A38C2|nr:EamA family transporter [Bacteriovorax sp. Seq25_V]EQC43791.1 EamA-like transporter family protein [Bacteriovorax sp. Seq25_V]